LSSLYFSADTPELTTHAEATRIAGSGYAAAIPLYVRFKVRTQPIVGTTLDYFDFRGLRLAGGRTIAMLGECVLGSRAAEKLEAGVGGSVVSSPESVFDIAGVYPLKMHVVGVLEPTFTADDEAVFVDLKTAWVIAGLAHGHTDVTAPGAESGVLAVEGDNVVANASVLSYTEITADNIDSFHFHGSPDGFPVDAILAVPDGRKSGVMLRGRYEEPGSAVQMVVPRAVVDDLVETMFSIRDAVFAVSIGLGLATIATAILVFALSIRLRRRELDTMRKIGASRGRMRSVLATEVLLVVVVSVALAAALTALVGRFGGSVVGLL
jgi:putative ABC transport system permease protein